MSKKADLKKAIAESLKEIDLLERKRNRSQAALVDAIIMNQKPREDDIKYFKAYTALIETERQHLQRRQDELAKL